MAGADCKAALHIAASVHGRNVLHAASEELRLQDTYHNASALTAKTMLRARDFFIVSM